MKPFTTLFLITITCLVARAELLTITLDTAVSNRSDTITINDQQSIKLKNVWLKGACGSSAGSQPTMVWNIHGLVYTNTYAAFSDTTSVFVGPASVYVTSYSCDNQIAATFDIEPSAFPPDKALTLGAYSGNVKVTMEASTDLVNWAPASNGLVYTNAPDARFFRIKMERNAQPPP